MTDNEVRMRDELMIEQGETGRKVGKKTGDTKTDEGRKCTVRAEGKR